MDASLVTSFPLTYKAAGKEEEPGSQEQAIHSSGLESPRFSREQMGVDECKQQSWSPSSANQTFTG